MMNMTEDEIHLLTLYRQLNADGQAYLMCQLKMMSREEALTKSYVERDGIRYIAKQVQG